MHKPVPILTILLALFACIQLLPENGQAMGQREPVVLVLEYKGLQQRERAAVRLHQGLVLSPYMGKAQQRIAVLPGDAIKSEQRPRDRRVNLYRGVNQQRILLGTIVVRYYRTADQRWLPRFQLHEQLILVPDANGAWQFPANIGDSALLMQTGNYTPNAEGYARQLEFRRGNGAIYVDAWEVQ